MNKKLLFEELEKFKLLTGYKTDLTLTENETILEQGSLDDERDLSEYTPGVLRGSSKVKKGELNFSGVEDFGSNVPSYAFFKNKGMFPPYPKNALFSIVSNSRALSIGGSEAKPPEPPKVIVIPINISTKVEDPFKFDTVTLYPEAEESLQKFFKDIKDVKNNYGQEVYDRYIQFLIGSKPITINAYASKDGNPNTKITGGYSPCKKSGTRGEYDKCLSQARAEYIKTRIETEFPELEGVFSAVGHGQSTQFSKTGWPNSKSSDETKADRRFDVTLPSYEETKKEPVIDTDTKTQDTNVSTGLGDKKGVWKISELIPEAPNAVINYSKNSSGDIVVSAKQLFDVVGDLVYKYIPAIGPGDINGFTKGTAVLTPDSITVTVGEDTIVWKNWKPASQAQVYDVTAILVTDFVPAVYKQVGDDLYIKGHAFAIQNLSA